MANTLAQIEAAVYHRMSEPNTSLTYDFTTVVLPKINSVILKICSGSYKDILRTTANNDVIYKAGDLRFLRDKMYIEKKDGAPITTAMNVGDVTVNVSTVNFTATGYAIINNNVFSYTGVTGTQLTGCLGIIVSAVVGTEVEQVFQIPTVADRTFQLFNIRPRNNVVEIEYQDFKFNRTDSTYFTVIEDSGTTNNFIFLPGKFTYPKFLLYYYKTPNTLVNPGDITILPDNSGIEFVANITAGELLMETEEVEDGMTKLKIGYAQLHDFYKQRTLINKKFRDNVIRKKPARQYATGGRNGGGWGTGGFGR